MGNGDGTFQGAPTIPGNYTGSNLSDVNGDGLPDLIIPASGTFNGLPAVFTVQLGTSKGLFSPSLHHHATIHHRRQRIQRPNHPEHHRRDRQQLCRR